ncbi:MAG: SAM-dependent methyltransferase, partial [Gammaproteobacteria bacterium]|nr:SAM-dependent methyltransferase [Gammaproteobacteria bacterium]
EAGRRRDRRRARQRRRFPLVRRRAGSDADAVAGIVARHDLPPGYQSEYNPRSAARMRELGGWLARGAAFVVDYGYPPAEYYHRERDSGTLTCFFRHVAHHDPLVLTGIRDITAHLDFTALAGAARSAGLDVLGYTSLAAFWWGRDSLTSSPRRSSTPAEQLALANEVKRLTLPSEMGELFKVLVVGRGVARAPSAFARGDRSASLWGAA